VGALDGHPCALRDSCCAPLPPQAPLQAFTLISDRSYISQSAGRISRALFEIALSRGWSNLASKMLEIAKCVDKRMWWHMHPLRQFNYLSFEVLSKLEDRNATLERLDEMTASEIGDMVRHPRAGPKIKDLVAQIPHMDLSATIQPITRGILRITLTIVPAFKFVTRVHGKSEPWWVWVEDAENDHMYVVHGGVLFLAFGFVWVVCCLWTCGVVVV